MQTSIGELKTGLRKPIHIQIARKEAINEFCISTYSKRKSVELNRRTIQNITANDSTYNTFDHDMGVSMQPVFDLSSRNIVVKLLKI